MTELLSVPRYAITKPKYLNEYLGLKCTPTGSKALFSRVEKNQRIYRNILSCLASKSSTQIMMMIGPGPTFGKEKRQKAAIRILKKE